MTDALRSSRRSLVNGFISSKIGNLSRITNMDKAFNGNVYNSGLDYADWQILRDVIWPFIHAKTPANIEIQKVPEHLTNHPLIELIRMYRETGDEGFLDQAGQYLVPSNEPFGWYVTLTK